jgi:hypothetical protein
MYYLYMLNKLIIVRALSYDSQYAHLQNYPTIVNNNTQKTNYYLLRKDSEENKCKYPESVCRLNWCKHWIFPNTLWTVLRTTFQKLTEQYISARSSRLGILLEAIGVAENTKYSTSYLFAAFRKYVFNTFTVTNM